MNIFTNWIRAIILLLILLAVVFDTFALGGEKPAKAAASKKEYVSANSEGLIGITSEAPFDNPVDNIFHVTVDEPLCGEETVWLVYDLEGVEDHTAVSRSINDQLSVGGYLVKKRHGWATQRERIHATWLKEGDNVVRFTLPENAAHSYRVRNLRLEVEHSAKADQSIQIVFNQPSLQYYFDKAYVKGLVTGADHNLVSINVGGEEARLFNGEFEALVDFSSAQSNCLLEVEARYADGTTTCHTVMFSEPETPDFEYSIDHYTWRAEKYVDAAKAGSLSLNGAVLDHVSEALQQNTILSITSLRVVDIPALDGGMVNVTKHHAGFRFLPHGTNFAKEVDVHVPFDPEKIPAGYTEQDIRTYYFDEQSHHWMPLTLDTVLMETGEVISKTLHFTDMINAIIKVPEAPEAEAYTSTSMKGIKAAHPTAAVNLLNPPQANNTGSASLAYELNIPGGRLNVQPQLSIAYNSEAGNSWMGMGWDLPLPAITIDTRWGVPRYNPDLETETYSLNGEQLTPVAHRGELRERNKTIDTLRFHQRVEGAFDKIIRHGTHPSSYWWEVTDKSGTKYFYGGTPAGFDEDAVLRTNENGSLNDKGSAAQWALRETRDLNGNTVRYHYAKVQDVGLSEGTVPGYQLYIDRITYTGYHGSDGPYEILFTRDRELNESRRKDVMILGNLGFKHVTADLLRKIEVRFDGQNIRSYELQYKPGEFSKTLLEKLDEYDAEGNLFNTHTFEYHNDVRGSNGFQPLANGETWSVPDDGIKETMAISGTPGFSDKASALSGNRSDDFSAGLSVTVAPGLRNLACKSLSVGGNYSYAQSESEGLLSMVDINGDGLSDKVFLKNDDVQFRENLGTGAFSETALGISGINDLYVENSKTNNAGLEANLAECKSVGATINKGWSWTTSSTTAYFADVNGDQLVDFVKDGRVRFNTIDPVTGDVSFTENSVDTPSPIVAGAPIADIVTQTEQERLEAEARHPLHDVVKVWQAPYDGVVNVTAPVKLMPSSDPDRATSPVDGVRVSVQFKNLLLWSSTIGPDDFAEHVPSGLNNLNVNKGDRLYFRVGSLDNGSFDQVQWTPVVEYQVGNGPLADAKDANGNTIFRFDSQKDFILTSAQSVTAPVDGVITIDGTFVKPQTTDSVHILVLRNDSEIVMQQKFAWNEAANVEFKKTNINVSELDRISFRVISPTTIDWSQVQWKPHLIYTSTPSPNVDLASAPIEAYPVPEYTVLPNILHLAEQWKVAFTADDVESGTIKLEPILTIVKPFSIFDLVTDEITFSVKKRDTLLARVKLNVLNGVITNTDTTLTATVNRDDTLFVEYHSPNFRMASSLEFTARLSGDDVKTDTLDAGVFTSMEGGDPYHNIILGPLYRGWGHFAWRTEGENPGALIMESELKLSDKLTNPEDAANIGQPGDLENSRAYDPAEDQFIMLTALGKEQWWGGYDNLTYVAPEVISSSRLGDDDLSAPAHSAGVGASAIHKISKSDSDSFSAGISGGGGSFNASGNYSWSDGNTTVITDYMDMNGDGYPDIVSREKIQYTSARGGLEGSPVTHGQPDVQNSVTHSEGVTVAGSAITSKAEPSTFNIQNTRVSVGSGQNSGGLNGSYARGNNHSSISWLDINGDGLPDRITQSGSSRTVALNLGYRFADEEKWNFDEIQAGKSDTKSAGLGVAFGNGSVNVGVAVSQSDNFSTYALMDVNGDGLADQVSQPNKNGAVQVRINTGNQFLEQPVTWTGATHINENSSTNESANVAFTIGIPIPPPPFTAVTLYINPSGSIGHGINREESKFTDMNGDGFPDFVKSTADNQLTVYRSTIGRTNLLKGVERPLGATFTLNYKRVGNTYEMPNDVWVLDTVKVFDGFKNDGADTQLTTFTYEDGFFNRHERQFYGFAHVTTNNHDTEKGGLPIYTSVVQTFNNDNYYRKGLLLTEVMTDGAGNKYTEKENIYQLKNISDGSNLSAAEQESDSGNAFPALIETVSRFYEGESTPGKTLGMAYGYDAIGNVVNFTDFGDTGSEDDLSSTITYHSLSDLYVMGTPKSIVVTGSGTTYRKRESVIDPSTGDIIQIKQFLSEDETSTHDLEYDQYGNLKKIIRPKNAAEQRLAFEYEYDNLVNTYTTKVSNSYGYSSEATYDVRFGQVLSRKDLNGNEIIYEVDSRGRVVSVTGPYEKGGAPKTIQFEYHHDAAVPWALTKHFDPTDPGNDLLTVVFVDGLGRVLQTKKDVAIYGGEGKADTEMMSVSGRLKFDAFGRTVSALYPITEATGKPGVFNYEEDTEKPTRSEYDVLNRTVKIIMPDNAVTETVYGFETDRSGTLQFSTKTTDGNGKQTEQFTDSRGRVTAIRNHTDEKAIWTSFKYNAINEQIEATDDLGHTIFSTYDNFGRRISRIHPDAGQTNYHYDLAGNTIQVETANLIEKGLAIEYKHDFERLTEIIYPENSENNVKYTYGEPGASDNRAGRIALQEDGSGAQEFYYGPFGEVVKNIRTVVIPQHDAQTFTTEWEYDTWNRLLSMTYADGEIVTYNYNAGGLLRSMSGKKKGSTYTYVNQLSYDKFEQRVYLEYGNGTKTTYAYEPDRRRLKNMTARTKARRTFMDNVYTYDQVNNILNVKNNAPLPPSNLMGGSSEYSFAYDDLYRLTSAEGLFKGSNDEHTYTLNVAYNSVGGITQKTQVHKRKDHEQKKTSYDLVYAYGETQPHAPVHIGEQTYTYDANGNQTGWTSDVSGQRRVILWDEENRIRSLYDNGSQHHYIYDAAGERVLKGKSTGQRIFVNGEWTAGSGQMGNFTVYVNPYLVLRSGGYTKHYYIEGQRIVSKLGGGWDDNGKGPLKAGGNKVDFVGKSQKVFDGIVRNLKFLGADGQILTAGKSGKTPPGQIIGSTGNVTESFRYFFHPDHLGSTSFVTDATGEVYQHLEYFAFGETFVEEHSNTHRTPYLFNGKELDDETGLYYYGARYYDPRTSIWESADPLGEGSPGWSPYSYSFNNPVRYIDPSGMWPDFSLSDIVHTSLDVVGLVPGFGEVADGVNAVIYLAEGNYTDAALSAAAMVPLAGTAATVAKIARKADKAVTAAKAADKAAGAVKAADKAKDAEKAGDAAEGVIYRVNGDKTPSGKPYIGSADDLAKRNKTAKDGRDRTDAEIVGRYPKGDVAARKKAEQQAMDAEFKAQGGKPGQKIKEVLDNKRNEIAPKNRKKYGLD